MNVPPLEILVAQLRKFGVDRGALIREPINGRKPGLIIFLFSEASKRDLGPLLIETVTPHVREADKKKRLFFDPRVSTNEVFKELERLDLPFAWCPRPDLKVTIVCLFGDIVTEKLCVEISNRGCPCTLKPLRPV